MNLAPKQQIKRLVENSEKILIVSHANIDGDGLGSSLALKMALEKMGKQADFVYAEAVPDLFHFLPGINNVANNFNGGRDFVIEIDCSETEIEKLKYNMEDKKMKIVVTPKNGTYTADDVEINNGEVKYDLVFVLDSSNLELTGKVYEENVDFFYEVPIVNIDHHASNEYFGKVNLVDVTATSTAEIVVSLLEALSPNETLLDEEVSTCLLNGIITDTGSFQNSNTTPKAFSVAAQLLAAGARQQEIIKHVFKTKELSTLKLWGKTLSKIKSDQEYKIVWSTIDRDDLEEAHAKESEISGVIDELMSSAPEADLILLIKEGPDNLIRGSLRSTNNTLDVAKIATIFGGGGHKRAAGFRFKADSLEKGEQEILGKIREYIDKFRREILPQAKLKTTPLPEKPPMSPPEIRAKAEENAVSKKDTEASANSREEENSDKMANTEKKSAKIGGFPPPPLYSEKENTDKPEVTLSLKKEQPVSSEKKQQN